jgi:hypothetical protein
MCFEVLMVKIGEVSSEERIISLEVEVFKALIYSEVLYESIPELPLQV